MEWALGKKKPFYVGKRAVDMQMAKGVTRKLAGFALSSGGAIAKECHLVIRNGDIAGRVTSVTRSPTLGRSSASPTCRPTSPSPASASRSASMAGAWSRPRRWRCRSTILKTSAKRCDEELEHGRSRRLSAPFPATPSARQGGRRVGGAWAMSPLPKASAAPLRGRIVIADLSPLPRLGFKGRGTIAAMQAAASSSRRRPIAPSASRTAGYASSWRRAR